MSNDNVINSLKTQICESPHQVSLRTEYILDVHVFDKLSVKPNLDAKLSVINLAKL